MTDKENTMSEETPHVVDTDNTALMPVERAEEIPRPVTLEEMVISDQEKGLAFNEAIARLTYDLRVKSIAITNPEDWVLFKRPGQDGQEGRATAYLSDAGCKRVKPLWGISIKPSLSDDTELHFKIERIPENAPPGDPFAYVFTGCGFCARTGDSVVDIEGVRRSDEDFVKGKSGIHLEVEVRKASRANMEGGIVRYLTGLQNLAASELTSVWTKQATGKTIDQCARGKGYGAKETRQGDLNPAEFGDAPTCPACEQKLRTKTVMNLRSGQYGPYWGCPNRNNCGQKAINAKKIEGGSSEPSGDPGPPEPGGKAAAAGNGKPQTLGEHKTALLTKIQSKAFPKEHVANVRSSIVGASTEHDLLEVEVVIADLLKQPKPAAGREPGE